MPKVAHTFTAKERKKLRKLNFGGFRLAVAGGNTDPMDEERERIKNAGYVRARPEVAAMQQRVDAAARAVVEAKTDVRLARGPEKAAARDKLREAQRRLTHVEREARKLGD